MNARILILSGHSWVDSTENLPDINGHYTMLSTGRRQIVDTKVWKWPFVVYFVKDYIIVVSSHIDEVQMILLDWKDNFTFTHGPLRACFLRYR